MLGTLTSRCRRPAGLTMIELLVAMAVAAILVVIAAPSFNDFMLMQRLKSVNAQLVTDLQFARSEAAARGQWARIHYHFDETRTCYTIYTSPVNATRCDCLNGAGSACTGSMREIRTVEVLRDDVVTVLPELEGSDNAAMAFDHISGGLAVIPSDSGTVYPDSFNIDTAIDETRILRTRVGRAGRPSVCAPAAAIPGFPACPVPAP
jgi:type IV fimbrial biogenesis protein FimT